MESPFLITQPIHARSQLVYQQLRIVKRESEEVGTPIGSEKYVNTKLDKICGKPINKRVQYYRQHFCDEKGNSFDENKLREENDKTLGAFILECAQTVHKTCDVCNFEQGKHSIEFYHGNGVVRA